MTQPLDREAHGKSHMCRIIFGKSDDCDLSSNASPFAILLPGLSQRRWTV